MSGPRLRQLSRPRHVLHADPRRMPTWRASLVVAVAILLSAGNFSPRPTSFLLALLLTPIALALLIARLRPGVRWSLAPGLGAFIGFGLGSLVVFAGEWIFSMTGEPALGPPKWALVAHYASFGICGLLGGAFTAASAGAALNGSLGFGMGMFIANFVSQFVHMSLQGGGPPQYATAAVGCAFGFALGGALGAYAVAPSLAWAGAIAFGIGGAAYGPLSFAVSYAGTRLSPTGLLVTAIPHVLGGSLFGAALGAWQSRRVGQSAPDR